MHSITAAELDHILDTDILPRVEKPSRYLGCEVNAIRKDPAEVDLRFALAFPDLYDLGLPNLGILILYETLNRQAGIAAERVYAPAADLEAILRERGLPLFSLESRTPLAEFDCVGFTLQYELCYTNILNMLDLAGIPVRSAERDDRHPIIIAGGPCVFNPEPLAEFIDAFAIGDGEDVVLEIAAALRPPHTPPDLGGGMGGASRAERLRRLAAIEGVYVPALYDTRTLENGTVIPIGPTVRKRVVADLNTAPFPDRYIVPFTQQVHDRASLEVLRGCTQGCRFCQAGMVTRPVRERSLETMRDLERRTLEHTGYEEIALSSLSTCDYSRVKTLVQQSVEIATPWGAAVSLPSLRLDSFSVDLSEMVQNVRKSGLTFAPEAATPRMRAVINKSIGDDDLLEMTGEVFSRGWDVVKLYFMIGLPTEEDTDVIAIADLSRRVLQNGRRVNPKARINLGVATFNPKAHTPFQWEAQLSIAETQRRQRLLNQHLRQGAKFGRHDALSSYLEGIISRGDRRVGAVLYEAWRRGCKMDAWHEHFDFDRWMEAFAAVGLEPDPYLRARDLDEPLPWDHIDILVTKEYQKAEWERSRQFQASIDCRREKCHQCGVIQQVRPLCATMLRGSHAGAREEKEWQMPVLPPRPELAPAQKMRFRFTKAGPARFLSHLEVLNVWTRALRRVRAPLAYSQGFHPQPKLAFGTALALGVESHGEYADVILNAPIDPAAFLADLNATLPAGFRVLAAAEVPLPSPALMAAIAGVRYVVEVPAHLLAGADLQSQVDAFLTREECTITRESKKGTRSVDIRPLVAELAVLGSVGSVGSMGSVDAPAVAHPSASAESPDANGLVHVEVLLRDGEGAKARPAEVVAAVFGLEPEGARSLRVRKVESYLAEGETLRPVL